MPYEYHNYNHYHDEQVKIIFHENNINPSSAVEPHWHKSPELLLVIEGELSIICDGVERIYKKDEIAVINNNQIHNMFTVKDKCKYFCLIVDSEIYDNNDTLLAPKCSDLVAVEIYKKIIEEFSLKNHNYKEAVIGYTKVLFSIISRVNVENYEISKNKRKVKLVKSITEFIYENFTSDITLEAICKEFNASKYYLSHIFKEITGQTIISHLNFVRCKHAKSLLKSGDYNVSESAYKSGFNNLSYFSKTYKNIMGNLPIKDLKIN